MRPSDDERARVERVFAGIMRKRDPSRTWRPVERPATRVGDTVELVRCSDPYTRLTPGERGVVRLIDALGTVHVDWASGSKLGLVQGEDDWRVVTKATP